MAINLPQNTDITNEEDTPSLLMEAMVVVVGSGSVEGVDSDPIDRRLLFITNDTAGAGHPGIFIEDL